MQPRLLDLCCGAPDPMVHLDAARAAVAQAMSLAADVNTTADQIERLLVRARDELAETAFEATPDPEPHPCERCGRTDLPLHVDYRCPECSRYSEGRDRVDRIRQLAETIGSSSRISLYPSTGPADVTIPAFDYTRTPQVTVNPNSVTWTTITAYPDDDEPELRTDWPVWTHWTEEDATAAAEEGWAIFDSAGSAAGPWQIQRFDDASEWPGPGPYPFEDDPDVWLHVRKRAGEGSWLHARALAFLVLNNPQEYEAIMNYTEEEA